MPGYQPFQVIGFHSCDKEIVQLKPSTNTWDWLGDGIYFWEQNPERALEYAKESAEGKQFNKIPINTPLVLGAIIELGNCLNLVESRSISVLEVAYNKLERIYKNLNKKMPINKSANRQLDCSVIKYTHQMLKENGELPFDTMRSAFHEGQEIYPGASFTSRLHIQICVTNAAAISGYFLPRPIEKYNPYLNNKYIPHH